MGINKYSVQLEAYFSGEMSETDRILFEGKIEANPALKAEFEKQNDIIEGLKAHRTAELKTRLNNISVQPTLIGALLQSSAVKPVAYGVATLILATGGYFFYNKEASIQYHIETLHAKNEYQTGSHVGLNPYRQLDYRFEGNLQILDYVDAAPVMKKRTLSNHSAPSAQDISFEVPEVVTSYEDSFDKMEVDLNAMDKISQVAGISEVDKVNIQTISSRKYNFHYRLEDDRLFLYGKFSESPYEIIEISTPGGHKKLFFYYHGDFYHLRKNATSITPLSKIENKDLILELDDLKGRG